MSTYLIKFTLGVNGNNKKQIFVPNKTNGGLPQDFLMMIPYFAALLVNSFSDSLKPNPDVNQMDLTVLGLTVQDMISYLTRRKAFSEGEFENNDSLFKPTAGVLRLAHFLQDRQLMLHFGQQYQFDYQTYLEFDEIHLSELASEYLKQVFQKRPSHQSLLKPIGELTVDYDRSSEVDLREKIQQKLISQLKVLKSEVIELSSKIDQNSGVPFFSTTFHQLYCDECQNIEGEKILSGFINHYLLLIDEAIKEVNDLDHWIDQNQEVSATSIMFYNLRQIVVLKNTRRMYSYADGHLKDVLQPRKETWSSKIRKFVNQNPGMAKLIWETEEFRNELLRSYLKVSNKKYRRYSDAMFEDLIPLVENRIGPNAPKISQELSEILRQDSELVRLHRKYNNGEEEKNYLRYVSPEDNERLEITWNQIVARKKFLTDRYNGDRQKNAPRGPVQAGWFM